MKTVSEKSLDDRARRVARKVGLKAVKGRKRNQRGFLILDANNIAVAGTWFELSAEDVLDFCQRYGEAAA